jgi:3-oxoadipate enol-lactonase
MRNGLYVEELGGEGAPLIFVHGLGGTSNTWYAQAQVLKRDFRVIGYDLAGSGRSSVPEKDISISSHVEDLRQLARETGGGRVHLAGHSMGTIICQSVAAEWPEIPASLVLAGALHRPAEAARAALTQRAAKARAEGMRGIAEAIVAGGTASDTKVNQPVAAAFVRESLMGQSAEGYARNCEALAQANAADLARISCPVLLLTGDEDKTASPDVARSISTALHKAELQILPACGHWTPVERPKQVSYAMTVFYSRIRRDAAL